MDVRGSQEDKNMIANDKPQLDFFAKSLRYPLNLQFFADGEGEGEGPGTGEGEGEKTGEGEGEEKQTFTKEELDSETSKRVEKALAREKEKFEREREKIAAEAKKEAESYAKLTQKEKEDAEAQKRLDALTERERLLNEKELLNDIKADLNDKSLPKELAEAFLPIGENVKIKEAITGVEKTIQTEVQRRVNESIRQKTPGRDASGGETSFAEQLAKQANKQGQPAKSSMWE